jgi:endoglycosylceramidase
MKFLIVLILFIITSNAYIQVKDNHFIDRYGRTRIFHGINLINKEYPYYPIIDNIQIQYLVNSGFNVVRLGCLWIGIEPIRYKYNYTYLYEIEQIIRRFQEYDIYVIIDNHQDLLSPKYKGDGFPNWINPKNDCLPFPEPLSYNISYAWGDYYFSEEVSSAFQNIYSDYDSYLQSLMNYWKLIAKTFKNYTNVLGYDLINEPWMGDIYSDPKLILEYGYADHTNLQPMYIKLSNAIRTVNLNHLIFFESVTWDYLQVGFTTSPDTRSVLSYHIYCLDYSDHMNRVAWEICNITALDMFMFRYKDIHRLNVGGFMTEFGDVSNTTDGLQEIGNMTHYANKLHQSWTYWGNYKESGIYEILSNIYPMSISGKLVDYNYYNNTFSLSYYTDTLILKPSVIYIGNKKIKIVLEPIGVVGYQKDGDYINLYNIGIGLINIKFIYI